MRKLPTMCGAQFKKAALWCLLTTSTLAGTSVLALWANGEFNISNASPVVVEKKQETPETSQAAQSFALQFGHEYFKWSVGLPEQREERLKPFLAQGMDPQAGLDFSKLTYHARPEYLTIWKVEPKGKGKSIITVAALVDFFDPKNQTNYFTKRFLLSIPIQAKTDQDMAVIDNPRLVPLPKEPSIPWKKDPLNGQQVDPSVESEIRAAAETFLRAYTSGKNKELTYLTQKPMDGFRGSVSFEEIEQMEVVKQGNRVFSDLLVRLSDPVTGMTISVPYRIEWVKEDGRWFVVQIQ